MKRLLVSLGLSALLLCPSMAMAKDLTIGLILVGPYNDKGYSQAQYEGGKFVEEKLPGAKLIYLDTARSRSASSMSANRSSLSRAKSVMSSPVMSPPEGWSHVPMD